MWAAFNYVIDDLDKNKDYFLETEYGIDHKFDYDDGKGWQDGWGTDYTIVNRFTATGTKYTVSKQSPLNQGQGWTMITYPLQNNKNKFTITVDQKLYVSNAELNRLTTRNPGLPPGFDGSDPAKSRGQYSDAHDYGANHSNGYLNDKIPSGNNAVASSSTTLTMEIDCCKGTATYSSNLGFGNLSLSQSGEVSGAKKMTKSH